MTTLFRPADPYHVFPDQRPAAGWPFWSRESDWEWAAWWGDQVRFWVANGHADEAYRLARFAAHCALSRKPSALNAVRARKEPA